MSPVKLLLCVCALALVSCGGGSESSGGSKGNFKINFSSNQIVESLPVPYDSFTLDITASGDPGTKTVYVKAGYEGNGMDKIESILGADNGTIWIYPNKRLWNGVYQGSIVVSICADSGCKKHLANSPYRIPYTFNVKWPTWRTEPINSQAVKEFFDYSSYVQMTVYTEANSPAEEIQMRMDLPDQISNISFDADTLEELSINNLSRLGFKFTPPLQTASGRYELSYVLNTINSSGEKGTFTYLITQIVSPENIDPDKFSFIDDKLVITSPAAYPDWFNFGSGYGNGGSLRYYLPYAECLKSNYYPPYSIIYKSGSGWLSVGPNFFGPGFSLAIDRTNLSNEEYEATIVAQTCNGQTDSIDVKFKIDGGFIVSGHEFSNPIFYDFTNSRFGDLHFSVFTSNSTGTYDWNARSLDNSLIITDEYKTGSGPGSIIATLNIDQIALMPNNTTKITGIEITDPNNIFEPHVYEIGITKKIPEVVSISSTIFESGKNFEFEFRVKNLAGTPTAVVPALAPINNQNGEAGFLPIKYSLSNTTMSGYKITVDALEVVGEYELILLSDAERQLDYKVPLVPRKKITFLEPKKSISSTSFTLKKI